MNFQLFIWHFHFRSGRDERGGKHSASLVQSFGIGDIFCSISRGERRNEQSRNELPSCTCFTKRRKRIKRLPARKYVARVHRWRPTTRYDRSVDKQERRARARLFIKSSIIYCGGRVNVNLFIFYTQEELIAVWRMGPARCRIN